MVLLFGFAIAYNSNGISIGLLIAIVGLCLSIASTVWIVSKSLLYQLAFIIAVENPTMSETDAVMQSEKLMTGKCGSLFILQLSFIGWALLATLTIGIGYLWLFPYIQFAIIAFYKFASNTNNNISNEKDIQSTNE